MSTNAGTAVSAVSASRFTSRVIARGDGWMLREFICRFGPHDRPFEEQHEAVAISAVVEGSFQYRSSAGRALLYPGSFLLGNAGRCFECGHEHARGDRCIAFHYDPWLFEEIAATAAGSHRFRFDAPMLPAARGLTRTVAEIEAIAAGSSLAAVEEFAIRLAETITAKMSGKNQNAHAPAPKDARRISEALRYIEERADGPVDLGTLARRACMSKYHFLRTFRRVAGVTPHQFLLMARLRRAALRLRTTSVPVGTVALEAGFNDLSTFNAHFRETFGVRPSAFRAPRR